jgi:hypothetical protein
VTTDNADSADDWFDNPVPPPRRVGDPVAPANVSEPPPKVAPKPRARKSLTPVDALADQLDNPPIVAAPKAGTTPAARRPAPKDHAPKNPAPPDADADRDQPAPPPPKGPPRPHGEIWDGCPVKALGVSGKLQYLLDVHGQLRAEVKVDTQTIATLFGNLQHQLHHRYPTFAKGSRKPKPMAFDQGRAMSDIISACADRGVFDPEGAVRGVGAWKDDDGALIYHLGNRLVMGGAITEPRTHHSRIYPAYPPIPAPIAAGDFDAGRADTAISAIHAEFETWVWQRPDIDPMICLGMLGVQMLGGALDWRPTFWVTGPKAAGKSRFHDLIEHIHGPKGLIKTNDATKAGLTARLGHSSLPVALDELEPGNEGSNKEADIIVLARVASSGGQWVRGSADQKGASGNVYSSFLFSSILIPGKLKAQDVSRLIVMSLNDRGDDAPKAGPLRAETWRKRGAVLKRILIDRWPTWKERLSLWRDAFAAEGLGGRNGDNWATVLAMACMARQAALPNADEMTGWARKISAQVKVDADEVGNDADAMLLHLLTQPYDIYRKGEQFNIAQWIMVAADLPGAPRALLDGYSTDREGRAARAKEANSKLSKAGLRIIGTGQSATLFIATQPLQGLKDLFARSDWANGVWSQSAVRIKGAVGGRAVEARYFDGTRTRGTEVPFASIPGLLHFPATVSAQGAAPADSAAPSVALPDGMEDFV